MLNKFSQLVLNKMYREKLDISNILRLKWVSWFFKSEYANVQTWNFMKVLDCYKFNEQHDAPEFCKHVSADTSAIFSVNLNIVCSRM